MAFVPRPESHLGLSPCNWCQGKREMGVQGCWPGRGLWGMGEAQPSRELWGGWAGRPPHRPSFLPPCPGKSEKFSACLLSFPPVHTLACLERPAGTREVDGTGGRRSQARRKLPLAQRPLWPHRGRAGVLEPYWKALTDPHSSPSLACRDTEARRGELTCSASCSHFLVGPSAQTPRPHHSFLLLAGMPPTHPSRWPRL